MKLTSIYCYYTFLILVIAFQVITTVFQGSLLVHQGYKVAQLRATQEDLREQRETIELQLHANQSIGAIEKSDLIASFEPVSKLVIVETPGLHVADSSH